MASGKTQVKLLFENATNTATYVVWCPDTKDAAIIDSVLDYDPAAARTSTKSAEGVAQFCKENGLHVTYILETHVHADHLTGARFLKETFPEAKTGIGADVTVVQKTFKQLFNLDDSFHCDGSQFDVLFKDDDTFKIGNLDVHVYHTPGHTPACVSYFIGDALFTGDTIFMPDMGTARCDFPGGSADTLYNSIQKLYKLPKTTRVFVGHDYGPGGREFKTETTLAEELEKNKSLKADTPKDEFVQWRSGRDATLGAPRLILPALQVNLRNGSLPPPESNGTSYLKIPLNTL